jgi:hypothetical protein
VHENLQGSRLCVVDLAKEISFLLTPTQAKIPLTSTDVGEKISVEIYDPVLLSP